MDWLKGMFSGWLGVPADGRWSLEWSPPTSGWAILAVVGTVGLFVYVWFIYRMEGHAGRGKKLTCAILRSLALLLLLWWILPRPTLRIDPEPGKKDAYILVLVDSSLSMTLSDHYHTVMVRDEKGRMAPRDVAADLARLLELRTGDPRGALAALKRADVVNKVLGSKKLKLLEKLGRKYTVAWTTFDESLDDAPLREVLAGGARKDEPQQDAAGEPTDKPAPAAPEFKDVTPDGHETDIALAIRQAIKLFRGKTIAAIVLVTDGRSTSGEDATAAAQYARNQPQPVPVFTVAVGDPSPPRNLRMAAPQANEYALLGDVITVDYELSVKGFRNRSIRIELEATRADGFRQHVPAQTKLVGKDDEEVKGTFEFEPVEKGEYTLTVRTPVLAEEINPRDNARAAPIHVRDEKIKVLLIAGGPSWEYRNLKNLFVRDRNILVSCWLQSADADWYQEGDEGWTLGHLPKTETELFKYDVVLMVDASLIATVGGMRGMELTKDWFELLKKFVEEHGGGLACIGGRKYSGLMLTNRVADDLLDILPVEPDVPAVNSAMTWPDPRPVHWAMQITPEGKASAILRLDPEQDSNEAIWTRGLPGPFWCFPVLQEKLGAQVLLRHGDPRETGADRKNRVLMATQFTGAGRSFFCGMDSTWRWNRVAPRYFNQFWNQVIRYLVRGRLLGGRKFAILQTDKDQYNVGDTGKLWTVVRLPNDQVPAAGVLQVTVKSETGQRQQIKLRADDAPGPPRGGRRYSGEFYPTRQGNYELELVGTSELPAERTVGKKVEAKFPEIEFLVPQMDEGLLRRVASKSGGPVGLAKFLRLVDVAELPDRIPTVDLRQARDPIRKTLWDQWPLSFLPFILLIVVEWVLRKFWRML
jgi:hypothetical protein